jgi:hypothetical protein
MLPNYLIDIFTSTNEVHDYSTRQGEFNFAKTFQTAWIWHHQVKIQKLLIEHNYQTPSLNPTGF